MSFIINFPASTITNKRLAIISGNILVYYEKKFQTETYFKKELGAESKTGK